jgi:acetyl-CoA acyltransferase 1
MKLIFLRFFFVFYYFIVFLKSNIYLLKNQINEAFASQAAYCVKDLNIPSTKVNPHGGAIALGHPLGCTGARQVATILNELKQYGKKTGVVSMCIGTGMGAAAVIEREN